MTRPMFGRRAFLAHSLAAIAAGGLLNARSSLCATAHRPIGLQLFTVMSNLEQDFEGTLKTVADIGYREVETIGTFGRDPTMLRGLLDKYGLKSPSQHLVPGNLYQLFSQFVAHKISAEDIGRQWQQTMRIDRMRPIIEEAIGRARILGQQYICLQIIWPEQYATRELLDGFCKALDTAGRLCADAGMTFNFHNHSEEFKRINDYVPYDVIVEATDPRIVKLEMDVYWMVHAGQDPLKYLASNPGRYKQFHLKDSTPDGDFAAVGHGTVDFPKLLSAAEKAGVEHYYVEFDRSDDPLKVIRDSYTYLHTVM